MMMNASAGDKDGVSDTNLVPATIDRCREDAFETVNRLVNLAMIVWHGDAGTINSNITS